uniref:Uncharacterized protein n=1 Tax=Araucaria cunninghamii TaxID=56994 RepID=A0A0D6QWZ7_ARACU
MGRTPCCSKEGVNRGAWTAQEDKILTQYIHTHGEKGWRSLPKKAGLNRCGKSCRLRWLNYLRPNIKRGNISPDEEELIIKMHRLLGNRWSLIAGRLPGRTDNEIKNYWNTYLSKKLLTMGTSNSESQMPKRIASWPQLPKTSYDMKEQSPSKSCSEDYGVSSIHSVKSCEIRLDSEKEVHPTGGEKVADISNSWRQFLEDSLMADVAEELLINNVNPNNDCIVQPSQIQPADAFALSNFSGDAKMVGKKSMLSHHVDSSLALSSSLPGIDFGMIQDFSVENLLQPAPYDVDIVCPLVKGQNDRCDKGDGDHANCFAKAAEQGMTQIIHDNTLEQPRPCLREPSPCPMDLDGFDHFFDYEENWENKTNG